MKFYTWHVLILYLNFRNYPPEGSTPLLKFSNTSYTDLLKMVIWFCRQPHDVEEMALTHRIIIFLIGIFEAVTWSGCIFGWPQLVQVLKMNGIYSHLCNAPVAGEITSNVSSGDPLQNEVVSIGPEYLSCPAQDERYAFIYTICCVLYSTPGICIGYSLHHFGLAATRVAAGLMMTGGFLLLSAITIETPDYLWGGAILISIGGNTIRMAGLQFGSLFPDHTAAATSIISGIFSASAAVFILFTYGSSVGLSWHSMCYIYALVASFILVSTIIIPWKCIPYKNSDVDINNVDEESKERNMKGENTVGSIEDNKADHTKEEMSLFESLYSLSYIFNVYWIFINMAGITVFATFFNSWINTISENSEEAVYYSRLYGYSNILCVFFTFLPGFVISILTNRFKKGTSGLADRVAEIQALALPMVLVSIAITTQFSCLLLKQSWAVYLALICLAINRPACMGVGMPFVRLRFPGYHFNRLIGLQDTLSSLFIMLQYGHFLWAQSQYYPAIILVLLLLLLGLSNPLHLLNKTYLRKNLKLVYSTT